MTKYIITSNDAKFRYTFTDCKLDIKGDYIYMSNTNSELIGAFNMNYFHLVGG